MKTTMTIQMKMMTLTPNWMKQPWRVIQLRSMMNPAIIRSMNSYRFTK